MDPLAQILAQQRQNQNQALTQAAHDANWSNTFQSTPPDQALQDSNNLHDLVGSAIDQKQRAMAMSDAKAAAAYVAMHNLDEYQRQAPLREQLLRSQIAHQSAEADAVGAHERFVTGKNTEAKQDLAALAKDAAQMKTKAGTPEHAMEITQLLANHPDAMTTNSGQYIIKGLSQAHEDVKSMTPPPGMVLSGFRVDDSGKQLAIFTPAKTDVVDPQDAFEDSLAASHPRYGYMDNGKFTANNAGDNDAQTHVQTTYLTARGVPVTKVLPRAMFDDLVAASQARKAMGQVPPAGAAPIPGQGDKDQGKPPAAVPAVPIPPAPAPPPGVASPVPVVPITQPVTDLHQQALQAIQGGAPRDAVIDRLKKMGGDPVKLEAMEQAQKGAPSSSDSGYLMGAASQYSTAPSGQ